MAVQTLLLFHLTRFFTAVIDNIGPCAARTLYTDFEMAAINAARDTISEVQIQGCFFHLAQSVYRKLCALGFQARYATDETFAVKVSLFWPVECCFLFCMYFLSVCVEFQNIFLLFQMKMLPALAFLPVGNIPEAFQDIMEAFPAEAIQVADYFEDVYIGRPRRNGICSAQFPPKMWSVHEATMGGMPRTNNSVEAWHYGLQVISFIALFMPHAQSTVCMTKETFARTKKGKHTKVWTGQAHPVLTFLCLSSFVRATVL